MRISEFEHRTIKSEAEKIFGTAVEVYLFGSRIDDNARGGDIDLLIKTSMDKKDAIALEARYYAVLQRMLGEQKIDIIVLAANTIRLPIHENALKTGIKL